MHSPVLKRKGMIEDILFALIKDVVWGTQLLSHSKFFTNLDLTLIGMQPYSKDVEIWLHPLHPLLKRSVVGDQ